MVHRSGNETQILKEIHLLPTFVGCICSGERKQMKDSQIVMGGGLYLTD